MPHLLGEAPFGARGWLCISYHGLGSLCLRGTNTNLGVLEGEGLLEASGSPGSRSELVLSTHRPSLVTQQTTRTSKCRVTRQPNKQRGNASLALEAAPCALTAHGAGVRLPVRSARPRAGDTRVPAALPVSHRPQHPLVREHTAPRCYSTEQCSFLQWAAVL